MMSADKSPDETNELGRPPPLVHCAATLGPQKTLLDALTEPKST